jgi:hypothetical protein
MYGPIFEIHGEDMLRCPYKDYSTHDRWQAKRDLLLYLLSAMTHLHQDKMVSIHVLGDVNSGPIASRRGLLEVVPIVRLGLTSVMR